MPAWIQVHDMVLLDRLIGEQCLTGGHFVYRRVIVGYGEVAHRQRNIGSVDIERGVK